MRGKRAAVIRRLGLAVVMGTLLSGRVLAQDFATGVTAPVEDLTLSLPVAGRIEGIMVKEGDKVAKGAVILHLDKTLEALEVKRRRLMLDDVARLDEARDRERILAAQVADARRLLETNSLSRKAVEDEELAWHAAVAERRAFEMTKRREEVEWELAKETLERRYLRAPIAGAITKLKFQLGESVGAHEPAVHLVDVRRVRFGANVPASRGVDLKVGAQVELHLGAGNAEAVRLAKVVFVSPVTDAASGLVEVTAEFDNADGSIRPGLAGRMLLPAKLGLSQPLGVAK